MFKIAPTRTLKLVPALALVALVLPSAAFGQATRTWVSGVGDDVNPCSRTAPCKTFAGAISKTATGGIINAMDDGGFGAVTITKPITIDGGHHTASILASGVNGVIVNITTAPTAGKVVLRNLDIAGNGNTLGTNGVRFLSGKSVKLQNVTVSSFSRAGVDFESSTSGARMVLIDTKIHDNPGVGLMVAPPNGSVNTATIRRVDVDDNQCGIAAATFGPSGNATIDCGTLAAGAITATATINAFNSSFNDNTYTGVFARGSLATIRLSGDEVTNNSIGLLAQDPGAAIKSYGNNVVVGNGTNGTPTPPNLTFTKLAAKLAGR
jgi:hypothetical protein